MYRCEICVSVYIYVLRIVFDLFFSLCALLHVSSGQPGSALVIRFVTTYTVDNNVNNNNYDEVDL